MYRVCVCVWVLLGGGGGDSIGVGMCVYVVICSMGTVFILVVRTEYVCEKYRAVVLCT